MFTKCLAEGVASACGAREYPSVSCRVVLTCGEGSNIMGQFVRELWVFMRERKKFWLLPILLVLLSFGMLIVLT
jgi:hypothetical protein